MTNQEQQLLASYAREVSRLRVRVTGLETAIERMYIAYHKLLGAQQADSGATTEQIEELASQWERTLDEVLDLFAGRSWMTRSEVSPLAAAAPDLLAACEAYLASIPLSPVELRRRQDALDSQVRAAVAKARGV